MNVTYLVYELELWCLLQLSTLFQLYRGGHDSSIGGENRSAQRKPPTCRNSLTSIITLCYIEYTSSEGDSNSQC